MEYGGRRIVGVGQHFVVKFGVGVNPIEGESISLVQENADTPIQAGIRSIFGHGDRELEQAIAISRVLELIGLYAHPCPRSHRVLYQTSTEFRTSLLHLMHDIFICWLSVTRSWLLS